MKRVRGSFNKIGDWLTVQRVGVILLALSLITGITGYMNQHPEGFDAGLFYRISTPTPPPNSPASPSQFS